MNFVQAISACLPTSAMVVLAVLLVSALSLLGVVLFVFEEKTVQKLVLPLVSVSAGALFGDVFIHIIPEMAERADTFDLSLIVVLIGILFSFAVETFIRWRHSHVLPSSGMFEYHPVGILSLIGEGVHNFIDGVAIASSFLASVPLGISTTIAVIFHEIPHEVGNFAVLVFAGYGRRRALLLNFMSAVAAIGGAVIVLGFTASFAELNIYLLPFAAGNLLYIAGSDLIPELHKEARPGQALLHLVCMIAGIALMYTIRVLEPQ